MFIHLQDVEKECRRRCLILPSLIHSPVLLARIHVHTDTHGYIKCLLKRNLRPSAPSKPRQDDVFYVVYNVTYVNANKTATLHFVEPLIIFL